MTTTSFPVVRLPELISSAVRLVVYCERPADASVERLISGLPAVPEIDIHIISGSDRNNLAVRVLRQVHGRDCGGNRQSATESKSAKQRLANCGPGSIHEVLARYSAKIDANLVIVILSPAVRLAHRWSASLAQRLARHFPVLAIPSEVSPIAFEAERRVRWLVPLDGSPSAETILDPLRSVAGWLPSDVTFLQPLEYAQLWRGRMGGNKLASIAKLGPSISDSRDYLARIVRSPFSNSPTRLCCTTDSDAAKAIVRLANSSAIDAVAIGLSNRWPITRLLTAELNELLLRRVRKPVLLVQSASR